ncbi:hypothetical protein Anas_01469 [Armadillidium nasatum]|uniref:Uncharacterized protein n=1 Tax=Armadillidium nasatum TaxID=96803 RepID=A0A5N5TLT3_9CRUS|nr:hypothetical protein Anas_01469 [Armadillidium nasatum]
MISIKFLIPQMIAALLLVVAFVVQASPSFYRGGFGGSYGGYEGYRGGYGGYGSNERYGGYGSYEKGGKFQ